jgi:branched-chain amino acid aminotransferase
MQFLLNGRFVEDAEARVPVSDRGFLYGDAAFDTLSAYGGRPFRAQAHLQRLVQSAAALRIELPVSIEQTEADLQRVIDRNAVSEAVLRVCVSRGSGPRGPSIRGEFRPTYLIGCYPAPSKPSVPIRLQTVGVRRTPAQSLPPYAKTANYLNSILALAEANDAGADEALMLDQRGCIAECAYSNVFFVADGTLLTPSLESGIIAGITRSAILELARDARIPVREADLEPALIAEADETLVTNSVRGIVPVGAIDGRTFAAPGRVTALLSLRYWELVARETSFG